MICWRKMGSLQSHPSHPSPLMWQNTGMHILPGELENRKSSAMRTYTFGLVSCKWQTLEWRIFLERIRYVYLVHQAPLACGSLSRIWKALDTWLSLTPPPTSRKLAGSPLCNLMISIVAIARPAPLTTVEGSKEDRRRQWRLYARVGDRLTHTANVPLHPDVV